MFHCMFYLPQGLAWQKDLILSQQSELKLQQAHPLGIIKGKYIA